MNVTKQIDVFKPVVIALESQEEVDALYTVTGSIHGAGTFSNTSVRSVTAELYKGLKDCGARRLYMVVEEEMELGP